MANFGDSSLKKQPGAKYRVAKNGLATYDVQFQGSDSWESFGLMQGDTPFSLGDTTGPDNVVLLSFEVSFTGDDCTGVTIDCHFEGLDETHTDEVVRQELLIDAITSHEPIESHPDFVIKIGGQLGSELNGAKFISSGDQVGKFDFFKIVNPDDPDTLPSKFAGITSYLMPQITLTQNDLETEWPDSDELKLFGKIVDISPIMADPPTLPGERNWLYTSLRVRSIANQYFEVQRVFMESGPRGWVEEIYFPFEP